MKALVRNANDIPNVRKSVIPTKITFGAESGVNMASDQKIIEILAMIRTIYPYYAKEKEGDDVKLIGKSWKLILSEYSDSEVERAFEKCLKRCKVPPTPADIVEEIESVKKITPEEAGELWIEYVSALRKAEELTYYFPFTFVEQNGKTQGENAREELKQLFNNLSYPLKKYIGSVAMLTEKGMRFDFGELKFEKPGFIKEIKEYSKPALAIGKGEDWLALLEENG